MTVGDGKPIAAAAPAAGDAAKSGARARPADSPAAASMS